LGKSYEHILVKEKVKNCEKKNPKKGHTCVYNRIQF